MTIHSYPSVYAIGHKAILDIFDDPVIVEEKIDGSQFSMAMIDSELVCRSKGKQLVIDEPEKMFAKAVMTAKKLSMILWPNWVYRCEYLQKPKHNTLAYDRVPDGNLIVFDIVRGEEDYLSPIEKLGEAKRLGLECVPMLFRGKIGSHEQLRQLLETESILGGCNVEGVVVKNYYRFTRDKKAMIGKYVSDTFKEKHATDWKKSNPSDKDIVQRIILEYRAEARWEKAVQHLRDDGKLEGSPRDIGSLIREVPADILKECEDEIKDALFRHHWPAIKRGITAGLPEWYKRLLAETIFDTGIGEQ